MRAVLAVLFAAGPWGLGGCAATCREACERYAEVCAAEFAASSLQFDLEVCEESCDDDLPRCSDAAGRRSCLTGATTCEQARNCPACRP